ncbi:amylo-alpha-1,6-glucosidase [Dactylosporangium aurantiacum]|uniref:Amylo-alpha-1,6-glucosidase n=1 Tax=Dactylosporangium aurantiacum TaxID=35754 RepID=A0A9Q9II25_9ACTN|nr:glycogen debranching N-terminal domain-containing protein [Dactylosporangium aurantiacum]MDG6105948.1 glycogen debranching N-terminal domain-containing protein [Dactylosporangium aurantiacum]UWZ56001.1 amylo-alpha-1,6-glucosidase [Dactylosporangium aurantiacum]
MAQHQLHERVTCVAAPATWLSGPDGRMTGGADGLFVEDRRALARLDVTVDGAPPEPLRTRRTGAASAVFAGVRPASGLLVTRARLAEPNGGTETVTLSNESDEPLGVLLTVTAATDFATTGAVRDGQPTSTVDFEPAGGAWWARSADGMAVRLDVTPAPDADALRWAVTVPAGQTWAVELRCTRADVAPVPRAKRFSTLRVAAADARLDALVRAGVQDLDALRRTDGADIYYSAGSPWYLTLFGRDALWAARLGLPLGVEVAAGTLRALAARQGTAYDGDTEEEPGKILHEVRPADAAHRLPPVYYGSVDATALFVCTLAEAYRWGMRRDAVAALLPNLEAALEWLAGHDGFVAYRSTGAGLTHQGWKDSADGVRFADGRVAAGTLALCEVQAYAYQAARAGADLLDAFGRPGGPRWRAWADALAERFRAAFWCPGGYPAVAVTGTGEQVDGVASNMGHLLGTGLLAPAERAAVAGHLERLRSPYGLRTLAPSSAGYDPGSYHAGSVWPHDTAIALLGLARDGHRREAAALVTALLAAGERFDHRLPELYGGDDDATPYPAACRPQAWAAAAGPALLVALLGLDVDVPAGRITFDPLAPSPVGAFRVRGLKVADGELDVSVDAGGAVTVHNGPVGVVFLLADGAPARIARAAPVG